MIKKVILSLIMGLFIVTNFAFEQAEFLQMFGDREVSSIIVVGLKRTTEKTFLQWMEIERGSNVSEYDIAKIYERISAKKIFNLDRSIEFFPTENDAVLYLTVGEKFSFFAVPFYNSVDGDKQYGGAAFDSNFWGYGGTLLFVGAFGKKDLTTFVLLSQDEMINNQYAGKLIVSYNTNEIEMTDIHNEFTYYESKQKTIKVGANLGKKFLDKMLTVGADLEWQKINVNNKDKTPDEHESDANFLFPGLLIEYDNTKQDFIFRSGFKAESLTSRVFSLDKNYDDSFRSSTQLSYSQTYKSAINLSLEGSFGLFDRPNLAEEALANYYGVKSLPNKNIYADDWLNGAVILEHTLISKHKLNPTLSYYYEGGYYHNDGLNEKYHGIGSELKIYFDKVAIPALGIGVAYNFSNEQTIFTFSFGMGGD